MLVVDTGPLVATADTSDKDHAACRALLEGDEGPLVTTAMVITEAAYLIDRQLGPAAEASLYDSIRSGELEIASLDLRTGSASGNSSPPTPACGCAAPTPL